MNDNSYLPRTGGRRFARIIEILVHELLEGEVWKPLGKFASQQRLMQRFSICKGTANEIIRHLKARRLIYSLPRKGSFVARRGSDTVFGVILSACRHSEIFPVIAEELHAIAAARNVRLAVADCSYNEPWLRVRHVLAAAKRLAAARVHGVVFHPIQFAAEADAANRRVLEVFAAVQIPVVAIDCALAAGFGAPPCDFVGVENEAALAALTRAVLARGRVAPRFLTLPYHGASIAERIRGFRAASGAPADHVWTFRPDDSAALARHLDAAPGVDAILCHNDIAAVRLRTALRKLGRRVPEDILVTGFDDVTYAALATPALPTVRQPCRDLAATALELLERRIADPTRRIRSVRLLADVFPDGDPRPSAIVAGRTGRRIS